MKGQQSLKVLSEILEVFFLMLVICLALGVAVAFCQTLQESLLEGEGVLLGSVVSLNCFLIYWGAIQGQRSVVFMRKRFELLGLMMGKQVLFLTEIFLCLAGVKPPKLFEMGQIRNLFRHRPQTLSQSSPRAKTKEKEY